MVTFTSWICPTSFEANGCGGFGSPSDRGGNGNALSAMKAPPRSASSPARSRADEVRMPEVTSPGATRQGPDVRQCVSPTATVASGLFSRNKAGEAVGPTKVVGGSGSGISSVSFLAPPRKVKPRGRKRTTAAEAYNKGLLLQYLFENVREFDPCSRDTTVDYEASWSGHQPLVPHEDDVVGEVPASEQRLIRRRRRRGVLTPVRGSRAGIDPELLSKVHQKPQEPKDLPGCAIPFPEDIVDPHIAAKEKWHPSEDSVHSNGDDSNCTFETSE